MTLRDLEGEDKSMIEGRYGEMMGGEGKGYFDGDLTLRRVAVGEAAKGENLPHHHAERPHVAGTRKSSIDLPASNL